MHQVCAEYSLDVCPHLFFEKTHRTSDEKYAAAVQIIEKPQEYYLVIAAKVEYFKAEGHVVTKYSKHTVVCEFEYVNGILSKRKNKG